MISDSCRARRALTWLGGAVAIFFVLVVATLMHSSLERELSELPGLERRALYERTRETLRAWCMLPRGPEVTDYCRQQADFITRFPECDGECRDLATRFAPKPSR